MGFFRFGGGFFDFFRAKKNYIVQRKVSVPSGQKKGWTDYYTEYRGDPTWGRKSHAVAVTLREGREVIENAKAKPSTQGYKYSYKMTKNF